MTRRLWQGWRVRTGATYVAALRDGRAVYLDGERVKDVTSHPAFAEPIRRIAEIYDHARSAEADPALTFADPATGRRHSHMWLVPRSAEDLGARRRVHRFWAEPSYGLMGRTPDHVACVLTAFAAWRQLFDRGGARFGDNVVRLYERAPAEGLRLCPRRPSATAAASVFDSPRSSRFDEVDTTVVFNDVFVPWEQVFIYRNVDLVNAQFHETPSHTTANFQALVRFGVKLEFMAGLALRLAEVQTAEGDPNVQATLGGEIAALCAAFDAIVRAAERLPLISEGVARPHPQYIYAGMALQRRLIVDMMRTLRELAGGAFQTVPSSEAAFASEETRVDTERYYRSTAAPARARIKLVKLVWDFVGTEFGGRQLQYEMFYSAAQPVVNRRMFRSYDWQAAKAHVDRCLGEYR